MSEILPGGGLFQACYCSILEPKNIALKKQWTNEIIYARKQKNAGKNLVTICVFIKTNTIIEGRGARDIISERISTIQPSISKYPDSSLIMKINHYEIYYCILQV